MVFYSERTKTYLEIDENISILSNNTIILTSERDEYKHLYQLDLKGKMTQITKGKWDVIDYYGINEKNNKVYYASSELGAIYKTIFSMGTTKIPSAPAFLSFSSISQNLSFSITECKDDQPSIAKGKTVGLLRTGRILVISSILSLGALSKMYLNFLASKTEFTLKINVCNN
jgi:dipeptidyl-peptidase-4